MKQRPFRSKIPGCVNVWAFLGIVAVSLVIFSQYPPPDPANADLPSHDYTQVSKNANTTDANTDAVLWTPASGKKIVLQGVMFSADATDTIFVEVGGATTKIVPVTYLGANNTPTVIQNGGRPLWVGAVDETLTYTTTTSANTTIFVWGYEESP